MKVTIGVLAILCAITVGAVAFELVQRGVSTSTAKADRLDRHCAFMKGQTKALIDALQAPTPVQRETAAQGFENLAVNDLRELKLCVDDHVNIDPNDRALRCSRSFDNDVPCALHILEAALAHWE